jgi:putative protein-disulfide isomerase
MANPHSTTLLFVMDPHCDWCFGFCPVIAQLHRHYLNAPQVRWEVLPGGLFVPAMETSTAFSESKRAQIQRIEDLSGVAFGAAYMSGVVGASSWLDSELPSRVLHTAKAMQPLRMLPFMADLLQQLFVHGENISDYAACVPVIRRHGFDEAAFRSLFDSDVMRAATTLGFDAVRCLGTSFPTLYAVDSRQTLRKLAAGYAGFEALVAAIDRLLLESSTA